MGEAWHICPLAWAGDRMATLAHGARGVYYGTSKRGPMSERGRLQTEPGRRSGQSWGLSLKIWGADGDQEKPWQHELDAARSGQEGQHSEQISHPAAPRPVPQVLRHLWNQWPVSAGWVLSGISRCPWEIIFQGSKSQSLVWCFFMMEGLVSRAGVPLRGCGLWVFIMGNWS